MSEASIFGDAGAGKPAGVASIPAEPKRGNPTQGLFGAVMGQRKSAKTARSPRGRA